MRYLEVIGLLPTPTLTYYGNMRAALVLWLAVHAMTGGLGQLAVPATGSSPDSTADIVAGLLNTPISSENAPQEGLPSNGSNALPLAPAPASMLVPTSNFTCTDLLLASEGMLSADTDAFVNAHRFVLQSWVYQRGLWMDTLHANYSLIAGVGRLTTLNRFWSVQGAADSSLFQDLVTAGPTSYLVGMQSKGFNLTTLTILGSNQTVEGLASQLPASCLQAVQPLYGPPPLTRLNLAVRIQGPGVLPFTAALQRELVSALLHTAAPSGAAAVQVMSYAEGGGASRAPLPFPDPPNTAATRRQLRQAASGDAYAEAELQVLCTGGTNTSAMLAALNTSAPSQILRASGTNANIAATSTLAAVIPASSSTGHSTGHTVAIAVPVVLGVALVACVAGCVWWGKRRKRSQGAAVLAGQPVGKTSSGLPFNQDLDSARGPGNQDPETPPQSVGPPSPVGPEAAYREPDHAPAGGVRIGPGRPQRSWLHRLTATPMRTTSGQNWLQVMRTHAAQPGEGGDPAADVHATSPVPQLRVAGLQGQNMEVDRVVARLRARENEQHDALAPVQAFVNSDMQEGMVLKGKYSMQSHGWAGPAYVLCSAYRTAQPEQHLSVKLFARGVDFLQEKALLETPTITLQEFLPGLLESYSASAGEGYGVTCPPCLLIHRPACTLHHWLSNARAEATTPVFSDKVSTLYNLLCAVHSLHVHRVVHCDLHPIQFGWFNESQQWKLLGVAAWAHTGSARSSNMTYTLRYAAPEVVQGDQSGREPPLATPAADVWALGVIAYEVLCGLPLFDKDMNQAEVVSMLLGYTAMPFEANPALFQSINAPPNAQNMLRQMLQRNPAARPALKDVRPRFMLPILLVSILLQHASACT
ncbi:hypothetical protein ABBQ32_005584 [Trebouxia sp. C0010 RCD-2024]